MYPGTTAFLTTPEEPGDAAVSVFHGNKHCLEPFPLHAMPHLTPESDFRPIPAGSESQTITRHTTKFAFRS